MVTQRIRLKRKQPHVVFCKKKKQHKIEFQQFQARAWGMLVSKLVRAAVSARSLHTGEPGFTPSSGERLPASADPGREWAQPLRLHTLHRGPSQSPSPGLPPSASAGTRGMSQLLRAFWFSKIKFKPQIHCLCSTVVVSIQCFIFYQVHCV